MIKLAIINTNNTIKEQIFKIRDELKECHQEAVIFNNVETSKYIAIAKRNMQLEALDILTASLNLVLMLNIPQDVLNEHVAKMISHSQDPKRMYEIIKWVEVKDVK